MTFLAFSHWRKSSRAAPILALLVAACASTEYDGSGEARPRKASAGVASRFEWAVQNYEAGDYEKAVRELEGLKKEGASLPGFDLLPFYLGMSYFRDGRWLEAAKELESFVRPGSARQEGQEGRVALLLVYEKLERWGDAAALAAETDKQTLFHYNRALLKLVWARALREQGELTGARAALEESVPFLDKSGSDDRPIPFFADPNQDLWGRHQFTSILVQETECGRLEPRKLEEKRKKKKKTRRLYGPWLDGTVDCLRKALRQASDELFRRDSPWSAPAEASLARSIGDLGVKIQGFLKEEAGALELHRALQNEAREQLYRLLGTLDERMKAFKDQNLTLSPLEQLRKLLDRLLVEISHPS